MFTKIEVAQEAATIALSAYASSIIATITTSSTSLDEDSKTVEITSALGGWMIARRLKPQTDAAVVWTAAKLTKIREDRKTKKNATQSETP